MKPRILVVDDSLTVRMDLGEAFEAAGFATALCASAAEARDELARGSCDLIVLDVLLPDCDGVELLKELRAAPATQAIPVILLSTESEVKDRVRGLKTGADEYVGKPYDRSYVVARARELARKGGPAPPAAQATTVLLIDDSQTFREEMRSAIEAAGYAVVTAATGEEGLRAAADARPGAVIVDGMLPGIDGATVVRRMRMDAVLRHTPCLLLTASEERSYELRALDAGADAYVRKDEHVDLILARLGAMLRSAGAPPTAASTPSQLGPKKILAVDDSLTYLRELASQLRRDGYEVALAHSGEEALELLTVQHVDCILLDLMMPGLSGQETCRRIKCSPGWRDIPLMMLTALEDRAAMIEGINAGADDYIAKSSEFEVLRARLRAQIRRKQFEDENRHVREQLLQKELEAAEARSARELAETRAALLADLEQKNLELANANRELEAFSYSVSHDLRAPLRVIDGFSEALMEDHADRLPEEGKHFLGRVRAAAQRMEELIEDLLQLSRLTRAEIHRQDVDLSALVRRVAGQLLSAQPERQVEFVIQEGVLAHADERLVRAALENLIGNALKFTANRPGARVEFGVTQENGELAYFVRDNGAGFDMAYAEKLFTPFQRLHSDAEFEGTGIGLATVQRIVHRHGGRVWAEGIVGRGANFYFTL